MFLLNSIVVSEKWGNYIMGRDVTRKRTGYPHLIMMWPNLCDGPTHWCSHLNCISIVYPVKCRSRSHPITDLSWAAWISVISVWWHGSVLFLPYGGLDKCHFSLMVAWINVIPPCGGQDQCYFPSWWPGSMLIPLCGGHGQCYSLCGSLDYLNCCMS